MSRSDHLPRFTPAQRWVHRSLAVLVGVCLLSAAVLYLGPLSTLVGYRDVVARVHVVAGLLLPVPVVVGLLSRAFRADVARLDRFQPADWEWLRRRDRRSAGLPVGKFNAGQKLNAAFVVGAVLVMLGTGVVMRYAAAFDWLPVFLRTGATWVHDWLAFGLLVVVIGHVWMAGRDPVARAGMRTGAVPRWWAEREHPAWAEEVETKS